MKTLIFVRGRNAREQIRVCEEYASKHDLEIVGVAKDEKELTVSVLGGGVECVIASEAHRIARSRMEYTQSEKMFNKFGVKLIAAGGTL